MVLGRAGGQSALLSRAHSTKTEKEKRVERDHWLSRIRLVPLGHVSYWLLIVKVGSSVSFGHGPADSCGHWHGAFIMIPQIYWGTVGGRLTCLRPKCHVVNDPPEKRNCLLFQAPF